MKRRSNSLQKNLIFYNERNYGNLDCKFSSKTVFFDIFNENIGENKSKMEI